jgi:hypothetical protein
MELSSALLQSPGFWVFVAGVSCQIFILIKPPKSARLEKSLGVLSLAVIIAGAMIDKMESHSLDVKIRSLRDDIKSAERNAAERMLEDDDSLRFIGIPHNGLLLHIFSIAGDHEGERFARSIQQGLGFGLHWNVEVSSLEESKLGTGLIPGGIFGPFGGDQNDKAVSTAAAYASASGDAICCGGGRVRGVEQRTNIDRFG